MTSTKLFIQGWVILTDGIFEQPYKTKFIWTCTSCDVEFQENFARSVSTLYDEIK